MANFPCRHRLYGAFPVLALLVVLGLTACGPRPVAQGVNDPYETVNRAWFESNLALDRSLSGEGAAVEPTQPSPLRRAVRNFGTNLSVPGTVLNDLLQLRPDRAVENSLRFVINTTIGLGGLFDPATQVGLQGRRSDFGETLHVWGVGEGAYVVLPFFGPSTERDTLGLVVDGLIDPLGQVLRAREHSATVVARLAGQYAERVEYGDLLEANVMRSADPYAQARLLFLQARRYHLGIETEDDFIDPYADFLD